MNNLLEEAYRAEIRKLIYPSLRNYDKEDSYDKIKDLLEKLTGNSNHDDFPVISVLYEKPLASSASVTNININLIDEDLVKDIKKAVQLKDADFRNIIIQEINLMFIGKKNMIIDENLKILRKNVLCIKKENATFWDAARYAFEEKMKTNDLSIVFEIMRSPDTKTKFDQFDSFQQLFKQKSKNIQRGYLIKIITELDYSKDTYEIKTLSGKGVLDILYKNGLTNHLLEFYEIHPCELSARLHLKLLEANIIQEDYENKFEKEEKDLKETLILKHLKNAQQKSKEIFDLKSVSKRKIDSRYPREEAVKILKELVEASGVIDLNKFLIEKWLIEVHKLKNDANKLNNLRDEFILNQPITLNGVTHNYENFENKKHFLESKTVQKLRKDDDVQKLSKQINEDQNRKNLLNIFLKANKAQFLSYGCNYFIFISGSIDETAKLIYGKLKAYKKKLTSLACHSIIIDAFKSFKVLISIRYSFKNESYDGIGHLGGFAKEIKRLQIKNENNKFEYKDGQALIAHLNEIIKKESFSLDLLYENEKKEVSSKQELIDYLTEFNDVLFKASRFFYVNNENTTRKQTALIAANKKFNNLCHENEKNFFKTIVQKYDKDISVEYNTENNQNILKAGINGIFKPERFRYDDTTVFYLPMSSNDFADFAAKNGNNNEKLDDITTVETLSLFELIQRFGYFADTGSKIQLISEHADYKSYAYKYPHEYFAGPIKMVTKILDSLIELYKSELNYSENECKILRLCILGHLFSAAQNEILDGKSAKLTKQSFENVNNVRKYIQTRKPARHVLNFKKYIKENIGIKKEGDFDEDQLKYIQTFFGSSIDGEDFDKIQNITSLIHMSVTLKNLKKSYLDSGRMALRELANKIDDFKDNRTTVYETLEYENEDESRSLDLSPFFKNYGKVISIKNMLKLLVNDSHATPDSIQVTKKDFIKELNNLIANVYFNYSESTKEYELKIQCKTTIKEFLAECMKTCNMNVEPCNEDDILVLKIKTQENYDDIKILSLNQYLQQCRNNRLQENPKKGFIVLVEIIIEQLNNSIYLEKSKNDSLNRTSSGFTSDQRFIMKNQKNEV